MIRYLITLIALCLSVVSFASETPCLDPLACNFMEEGECFFTNENGEPCVTEGCTIQGACNYDPEADIYDGSCEFESCLGCTDAEACNYDETALYDDATCIYYVDCNGTCGGDWIEDACGNCYDAITEIEWQHTFTNCSSTGRYGPSQSDCDGQYGVNFVVSSDGVQEFIIPYTGLYLAEASGAGQTQAAGAVISGNFFFEAGQVLRVLVGQMGDVENGCGHGGTFFTNQSNSLLLVAGGGAGMGSAGYYNGLSNASFGSCGNNGNLGDGGCDGQGGSASATSSGYGGGGGGGYYSSGFNDEGSNYADGGTSFLAGGYGGSVEGGEGGFGGGGAGIFSEEPAGGGGYSGGGGGGYDNSNGSSRWAGGGGSFISEEAENSENVAINNNGQGSLTLVLLEAQIEPYCNPGCTYSQACNYNPDSNFDDGSCDYCFCGEGTQWVDSLQACMVTDAALMQACGEGTYWDDLAQACLTIETCQEDLDGDGVIGVNDLLELLSSFGSECVPEPETAEWTCGDPVNYHGFDYATVQIGEQCWFAENLRNEHYANGDAIPGELSNSEWQFADDTNLGAQAIYNNDVSNLADYGRLYNWYAVDDGRGLCPSVWHVPTDGEFMTLEMELGMSESEANGTGQRGTDQGAQMKSSPEDSPSWNGTNTSGFSGLAGGIRSNNASFSLEDEAYFWSDSADGTSAWYRVLGGNTRVSRTSNDRRNGFSVRCVRD